MTYLEKVRAYARAVVKFILRVIRIAFILALVVMPMPLVAFVAVLLKPRRSVPAQVLRKENDR